MAKKVTYKGEPHEVLSSHTFAERKIHVLKGVGSVPASECKEIAVKANTPAKTAVAPKA